MIRPLQPRDKDGLIGLTAEVLGEQLAHKLARRWHWQFESNPCRRDAVDNILVLELDGRPMGMLLSFPIRMRVGTKIVFAYVMTDFLTHPRCRSAGAALAKTMTDLPYLFIGIPTGSSYPLWNALGCLDLNRPVTWICRSDIARPLQKRIGDGPVARLLANAWRLALDGWARCSRANRRIDIAVERIDRFGDEADRFWQQTCDDYAIAVVRDSAYLNWRFADHPQRPYAIFVARRNERMTGYLVCRHLDADGGRRGCIVDFLARRDDRATLHALFRAGMRHLRDRRVDIISCLTGEGGSGWAALLRRHGFFFRRSELRLIGTTHDSAVAAGLQPAGGWFLTFGDGETDIVA